MSKETTEFAVRLGRAIARERTARQLTQEALAEKLGVEQETISRFERGSTLPPLPRLIELANIFDMPVEYLLRGTTERPSDDATEITRLLNQLDSDGRDFVRRWVKELCEQWSKRR